MRSWEAVREEWAQGARSRPVHPSMVITGAGLVLGLGTVLARASVDRWGRLALAIDDDEERIRLFLNPCLSLIIKRSRINIRIQINQRCHSSRSPVAHIEVCCDSGFRICLETSLSIGRYFVPSLVEDEAFSCSIRTLPPGVTPIWPMVTTCW